MNLLLHATELEMRGTEIRELRARKIENEIYRSSTLVRLLLSSSSSSKIRPKSTS